MYKKYFYVVYLVSEYMAKSTINLPIMLLHEANADGWLLQLSFFVRLKSYYSNSIFYNSRLISLSKELNVPVPTLSRYIKFLTAKGLLSKHHGNLCCLGNTKIKSNYEKCSFSIQIPIDHDNQLIVLRSAILELNLKGQQYHIDKSVSAKYSKKKIYKTFKERYDNTRKYTGLSIMGISRLLNISKTAAMIYKNKAVSIGLMTAKTKRFVHATGESYEGFCHFKKALHYSYCNVYYFRRTGSIVSRLHDELHIRLFTTSSPLL